jgi:hypothetical protein
VKIPIHILVTLAGAFTFIRCAGQTNASPSIERAIIDSAKWGASTNGVQLGIDMPFLHSPLGKNQFVVFTYLLTTNVSGFFGPAPAPHGYRLDLYLRDSEEKLVKRTKAGNALCKPVNLFMKSTMHIEMVRGVFGLMPNTPRKYDDPFNLLDCFKVEKIGTYTLFVRGKLYRQISSTDIEPMALPETSLQVLITQTDLDRYRASKEDAP